MIEATNTRKEGHIYLYSQTHDMMLERLDHINRINRVPINQPPAYSSPAWTDHIFTYFRQWVDGQRCTIYFDAAQFPDEQANYVAKFPDAVVVQG